MSEAARVRSTPRFAIEAPAFAAVGIMNTLIDGAVFAFLVGVLGIANGGAAASVASAVAYLSGASNSYFWNSRVTFAARPRRPARFAVATAASLALSTGAFALVIVDGGGQADLALAKAVSLVVGSASSFILCRNWAFR